MQVMTSVIVEKCVSNFLYSTCPQTLWAQGNLPLPPALPLNGLGTLVMR